MIFLKGGRVDLHDPHSYVIEQIQKKTKRRTDCMKNKNKKKQSN